VSWAELGRFRVQGAGVHRVLGAEEDGGLVEGERDSQALDNPPEGSYLRLIDVFKAHRLGI